MERLFKLFTVSVLVVSIAMLAGCDNSSGDGASSTISSGVESDISSTLSETPTTPTDANEKTDIQPIGVESLNEGVYNISVKSSSSMFKIIDCELIVEDDTMTAVMTLSGTGYGKLFMGTGEEAMNSGEESFIPFVEDEDGRYSYTVPVEALDKDIDCAAWSIKKEEWYDRVLVFESEALPTDAFADIE